MKEDFSLRPGNVSSLKSHVPLLDLLHRHSASPTPTGARAAQPKGSVAIDVKEDESSVTVFADLPGVDEDEIKIDLESNILLISAEREFDHDNEDSEEYLVLERSYGPVNRAVNVPGQLDKGGMTAKYKRGVLKVRIPKFKTKVSP